MEDRQEELQGHTGLRSREVLRDGVRVPLEAIRLRSEEPQGPDNSLKTYATNPLWQVVDGPWHLTQFDSAGTFTMEPNPKYSGPVKPKIDKFVMLPYTSNAAEFNALVGGKSTSAICPTRT